MGSDNARNVNGEAITDLAVVGDLISAFYQSPAAMVCVGTDLRITRVNPAFCRLTNNSREEILGRRPSELNNGVDNDFVERVVADQVIKKGIPLVDARLTQRVGSEERTLSWSVFRLEHDGRVLGAAGLLIDISERIHMLTALQRAHFRLDILERAGNQVGTTLDIKRTATELAELAVPELADRVSVDLLDRALSGEAGDEVHDADVLRLRRVVVRDIRPRRETNFNEGQLIVAPLTGSPSVALITGKPILLADVAEFGTQALYTPADTEAILDAGIHTMLVVPLIARGVTLGVVAFMRAETSRRYEEADLRLVSDLASRAATSVDNARLYTREHANALTLQQSLLPKRIPQVPGLVTAYRYRPVNNAAQVGGDWFDVIPSQNKVALVVGDVTGHDIHAAAVMGQLRITMANLVPLGLPAGEIMNRLTRVVADHYAETAATCVYALYDPLTRCCQFTTAGHPPPVLRHPNGAVEFVDVPSGTMLGWDHCDYDSLETTLAPGSTIALYTDGLVEKPHQDIGVGMTRLASALAASSARESLNELCDSILFELGPYNSDDVALLLARTDDDTGLVAVGRTG